jgi:acid phosphatase type 7
MKFVFLCTGFFLLLSSKGFTQPKGIHLSWNGNKKVNTSNTMAITWMNDKVAEGDVLYGTDSLHLYKKVRAAAKYVAELSTHINKVTLRKLSPATYYYYKLGSDENGWSLIYKFKTGPKQGDQSKIIVGLWSDTQNNGGNFNFEQTDTIVKQLSKNVLYFTIHNGDIVENGSIAKNWKGYFDVAQPINGNYPLMSVTGNHDVVNDTASAIFQKPTPIFYELMNLPNNQLNYSYDYGNVHFIAINSGWAEGAAKAGKVLFEKNSQEYKWLEKDLKKATKNKNINWIILYSHYPVYSFGFSHIPTWQRHIKPLVDKYEVDLYLAGHRHVYERHKAIRGGEIFAPEDEHVYNRPKGTVYITNGSCGGNLTGTGGQNQPEMIFTPTEKIYTYAVMTIEGKQLHYDVYDKDGNKIDYFSIIKK